MKNICLILLLLDLYVQSFAQTDTLVFYPVENRIIQEMNIWNICIAKDGKLWLSNDNGVASFDGNDVRYYGHGEGGNLVMGHKITVLSSFDSKGNLYADIAGGWIYHINTVTGKYLDVKNNDNVWMDIHVASEDSSRFYFPKPYTSIITDNDNTLWCGRTNMGFIHYEPVLRSTTVYRINNTNTVYAIQNDMIHHEILWLATDNGIWSFNKKTQQLKRAFHCKNKADSSIADVNISNIKVGLSDTIWFTAVGKGVGYLNKTTGGYIIFPYKKKFSENENKEIKIISFQAKNNIEFYVGMENNEPSIFNTATHQYIFNIKFSNNFPSLKIRQIIADSTGNLWCILFGRLFVATPKKNKFTTISLQDINKKNQTVNIFKTVIWDAKAKYYYAAFDNSDVIYVLDNNKSFIKTIPIVSSHKKNANIYETHIYDIALDNKHRLWCCGTNLSLYDSVSRKMVPVEKLHGGLVFRNQQFQNLVASGNYLYMQPSNEYCSAIYRINTLNFCFDSIPIPDSIVSANKANIKAEKQIDVLVIDKQGKYAYIAIHKTVIQIDLQTKNIKKVATVAIKEFELFYNMYWYALDDNGNLWISEFEKITVYETKHLQSIKIINKEEGTYHINLYNAYGKGVMCILYSQGIILYDYSNNGQYHLALVDGLLTLFNSGISCVNNTLFVGSELNALQYINLYNIIGTSKERSSYIAAIQVIGKSYYGDTIPEYLHSITLPYDKNAITLTFSSTEFLQATKLSYRYKLSGIDQAWRYAFYTNNSISYNNLSPGDYTFFVTVLNVNNNWSSQMATLQIHILPAWWQTDWFKIVTASAVIVLIWWLISRRIRTVRRKEKLKSIHEKELLELEAKALRAQMNPHFIFNCLNSIKSLIQENENEKSVTYLTTFSKLIRTLLNNADKKEISLYDEIETCKYYLQLEAMRFDTKFSYVVDVDNNIDLKSIQVPALIIQPFIENAIWHGIVPRNNGGNVSLNVVKKNEFIEVIIDDDGIGRITSQQNKSTSDLAHQSKGVNLTQSRLELNNLLQQRQAKLEIIDNKDEKGIATGTTVIIKIKEEA